MTRFNRTNQEGNMPKITMAKGSWRPILFTAMSGIYMCLILGVPTLSAVAMFRCTGGLRTIVIVLLPIEWSVCFVVVAGLLSLPHQFAVKPGKIRRDVSDRRYFHRRLYGLCWTAVYYNKPVYFLCLSIPSLKWLTFHIFGYRGGMDFTVYPDTWIRDLPLLTFGAGAYVSNRATLGTNIVLSNGFLLVDAITLGANSLVGHLAMLAPGVELEADAEVAVGCGVGIGARLGRNSFVGPCSVIEHGVHLGTKAAVGAHSYIGSGAFLSDGVRVCAGSVIKPRTKIAKPDVKHLLAFRTEAHR
jgi:UDP-3-O-[3-hydroxymyristoyl] glucosamine N-acyltransferase